MDDHLEDVHDIEGGATALLPFREIEVNASITFEVPDLTTFKNGGEHKKFEIIRAFYIQCVSRGVVNRTNKSRSREFMK